MPRPLAAALLALLLTGAAAGCHVQPAQGPRPFVSETVPLRVGESEVALAVHSAIDPTQAGPDRPAFLVLHDSEDTAVEAGLEALGARGGRLVEVLAGGERLVAFGWQGQVWSFDPNRVFTDAGAEATLVAHSGSAPPDVLAEVRRFAETVLAAHGIGPSRLLVTLHNNTDGDYSAASYAPGGELAGDAAAVHLPVDADPDDFFFVTDRRLYDPLTAEGFPVVLQDNEGVTDDGSLSVWAARRGIAYVNVEAEHGHRERQVRMLDALARATAALDAAAEASGTFREEAAPSYRGLGEEGDPMKMKKLALALVLCAGALAAGSPLLANHGGCHPNPRAICPDIYAPVTCSNGVTYENSCRANAACATGCVSGVLA